MNASPLEIRLALRLGEFSLELDLQLPGHGVTAVFGPSGCGKTTLLRCLAGLHRAERGRVVVSGEVWQDERLFLAAHRRAVGVVFQEASLFGHLTVQGNLDYGHRRIAPAQRRVAMDAAVELLGLAALLGRRPDSLSGGERQRVAIARALLVSPQLLLMDEPLASLDAQRKAEILPFLDRLQRELTMPLVYVSHSAAEVARLADHLVLMQAGRCLANGAASELMARLDLPLARDEAAGVVVSGTVAHRDTQWHLLRVDFDGGSLWVRDQGQPLGRGVRVRVLARDVSLALAEPVGSSIVNSFAGTVEALGDDDHPALLLARVRVGATALLARLTRQSAHRLGLVVGSSVWAQVKSVALFD